MDGVFLEYDGVKRGNIRHGLGSRDSTLFDSEVLFRMGMLACFANGADRVY